MCPKCCPAPRRTDGSRPCLSAASRRNCPHRRTAPDVAGAEAHLFYRVVNGADHSGAGVVGVEGSRSCSRQSGYRNTGKPHRRCSRPGLPQYAGPSLPGPRQSDLPPPPDATQTDSRPQSASLHRQRTVQPLLRWQSPGKSPGLVPVSLTMTTFQVTGSGSARFGSCSLLWAVSWTAAETVCTSLMPSRMAMRC